MAIDQAKMVSLPGDYETHPNSYWDTYGNDLYLTGLRGPSWGNVVRIWTSMLSTLPSGPPGSFDNVCSAMNASPAVQFLDRMINKANNDGVRVLLCLGHDYPAWINGASGPEPVTNKAASQRLPIQYLEQNQPWDWWVSHLYNRYRFHSPTNLTGYVNGTGPTPSNPFGNPYGAWIWAIEPFNEPNQVAWQNDPYVSGAPGQANTHCVVAKMMQTLDALIAWWGPAGGVLAPSLSDRDKTVYKPGPNGSQWMTVRDYYQYADLVLGLLANWRPLTVFQWSHHNYLDTENGTASTNSQARSTWRVHDLVALLGARNWRGGGDRNVWITEGGCRIDNYTAQEQQRQSDRILATWNAYKGFPQVQTVCNHTINQFPGGTPFCELRQPLVGANPGPALTAWSTYFYMQ
jgi:hypothetical protein